MMELKQSVYAALVKIKQDGPTDTCMGICGNVTNYLDGLGIEYKDDDIDNILCPAFAQWPDKSHSTAYPIGSWDLRPDRLFWDHYDYRRSMWEPKTKYGAARIELLEWTIKVLAQ